MIKSEQVMMSRFSEQIGAKLLRALVFDSIYTSIWPLILTYMHENAIDFSDFDQMHSFWLRRTKDSVKRSGKYSIDRVRKHI